MSIEPKVEDLLASIRKAIDNDLGEPGSSTKGEARGTLMRGALREMRVNLNEHDRRSKTSESEISDLRNRILRSATEVPPMPPPPRRQTRPALEPPIPTVQPVAAQRADFRGIMAGGQRNAPPPALPPPYAEDVGFRPTMMDDAGYQDDGAAGTPYRDPYQDQTPDYGYEQQPVYSQPREPFRRPPPQRGPAMMSPQSEAAAQMAFRQLSETLLARAGGERSIEDLTRELLRGFLKQWLDDNLPGLVEKLVREEIARVARRGR